MPSHEELNAKWRAEGRFEPFKHTLGPRDAKIMFVAEAWGEKEDMWRSPLVGSAGIELARMLGEANLTAPFVHPREAGRAWEPYMIDHWTNSGLLFTNTFCGRPPNNDLEAWCVGKKESDGRMPMLKQGKYIHPAFGPHLDRLYEEITLAKPNLLVLLGNTACWAVLRQTAISKLRGAVSWCPELGVKVLPTYHPSGVLRDWSLRPVTVADLIKAKREGEFPELRRANRWLIVQPTLEDIREWMRTPSLYLAVDIETDKKQISMIGFARSPSDAIVIPFMNPDYTSYWRDAADERRAWELVRELLEGPAIKIFQNGLYDLSYLARMGFRPRHCDEDTMLLHHSLFPEMRKGLDFLGSIYSDEGAWKLMRKKSKDMLKREE